MGHVAGRARGKRLRTRQLRETAAERRKGEWDGSLVWHDHWSKLYALKLRAARGR